MRVCVRARVLQRARQIIKASLTFAGSPDEASLLITSRNIEGRF